MRKPLVLKASWHILRSSTLLGLLNLILVSMANAGPLGKPLHNFPSGSTTKSDTIPDQVVYKKIDTLSLKMEVYLPDGLENGAKVPAMVFFFGGGWVGGSTAQFAPHARYFSKRGLVCFLVDYRVEKRQGSTPFESLKDAKSAIRFIKSHAAKYHVDTARIIAAGGSAGGHLAAATALTTGFDEKTDNLSVSPRPAALVLFNPVIDNSPEGYGYERVKTHFRAFSPIHNIKEGAPPTLFFLGTRDKHIPVETARRYKEKMEANGSRCDLFLYKGQGHGFFNARKSMKYYRRTVSETDRFLVALGFLKETPLR